MEIPAIRSTTRSRQSDKTFRKRLFQRDDIHLEQNAGSTPSARDPRNRNLDRAVTSFDRTHVLSSNGAYQLPFGTNHKFLSGAPSWVDQIVGQWQVGGLLRWLRGRRLTLTGGTDFRTDQHEFVNGKYSRDDAEG